MISPFSSFFFLLLVFFFCQGVRPDFLSAEIFRSLLLMQEVTFFPDPAVSFRALLPPRWMTLFPTARCNFFPRSSVFPRYRTTSFLQKRRGPYSPDQHLFFLRSAPNLWGTGGFFFRDAVAPFFFFRKGIFPFPRRASCPFFLRKERTFFFSWASDFFLRKEPFSASTFPFPQDKELFPTPILCEGIRPFFSPGASDLLFFPFSFSS